MDSNGKDAKAPLESIDNFIKPPNAAKIRRRRETMGAFAKPVMVPSAAAAAAKVVPKHGRQSLDSSLKQNAPLPVDKKAQKSAAAAAAKLVPQHGRQSLDSSLKQNAPLPVDKKAQKRGREILETSAMQKTAAHGRFSIKLPIPAAKLEPKARRLTVDSLSNKPTNYTTIPTPPGQQLQQSNVRKTIATTLPTTTTKTTTTSVAAAAAAAPSVNKLKKQQQLSKGRSIDSELPGTSKQFYPCLNERRASDTHQRAIPEVLTLYSGSTKTRRNGFERGMKVEKILSVDRVGKDLYFYIVFENGDRIEKIPASVVNKLIPQTVIKFYEEHIDFL